MGDKPLLLTHKRLSVAEMFPANDARFRTSYVDSHDGVRLRVVECGDPNADDIVVCLHGWICSVYTFRIVMPLLADAGRRVIAIDLPGHGLSDKPEAPGYYTTDAITRCVADVVGKLGIAHATYLAHSMGCVIAARIAQQRPEHVKALVLCAPAGFERITPLKIAVFCTPRFLLPVLPYLAWRWTVPAVFRWVYGTLRSPTERDYDEYWAPTQFPGFVRAVRLLLETFDWEIGAKGGLDGIRSPATIVYGGKDPVVTSRSAQRYTQIIPCTRLVGIPESGHVVPEEAPAEVAAAVLERV